MRALGLGLCLLLAGAACGGGEEDPSAPLVLEDPGPVHVHGLGVVPDGSLYIATHTGLWRLQEGETKARRVGDSYQDTMGFTVLAPDRFLGSGHPDLTDAREFGLPPLLGLVESRDGGLTWTPVSLLGEADFHVLRAGGERVYGFDASKVRLLVSNDAGATWEEQQLPGFPPEPLVDLAVDPARPERLVASSERALYQSTDGGRTWERLEDGAGLLAWPAPGSLFLLDAEGRVRSSAGPSGKWSEVGEVGGAPAALVSVSPETLYVALHDGTIRLSEDGGATWTTRSSP